MSGLFENQEDRDIENEAIQMLRQHLMCLGVGRVSVTNTTTECSFDYEMRCNDSFDSVVEIRGINYSSDQVEGWGHLVMDEVKLKGMKELFYDPDKKRWTKKIVICIYCKTDRVMYCTSMQRLLGSWDSLKEAPQSMMKSDHGEGQHTKKGYLIPLEIMDKII